MFKKAQSATRAVLFSSTIKHCRYDEAVTVIWFHEIVSVNGFVRRTPTEISLIINQSTQASAEQCSEMQRHVTARKWVQNPANIISCLPVHSCFKALSEYSTCIIPNVEGFFHCRRSSKTNQTLLSESLVTVHS